MRASRLIAERAARFAVVETLDSGKRLAEAFAIISAGVGFYLLRKIFTLGQW